MSEQSHVLSVEAPGERLDKVLAGHLSGYSRVAIQRMIKTGAVTVNGRPGKASYRVEAGDEIRVQLPAPDENAQVVAENIPLQIVYEDDALLVVDKPAGMVVHPAYGHTSGTLVNALLAYAPAMADVGGVERAGIVHRLDKDTSGLLVVAKDPETHAALQRQFKRRQVSKTYLALVEGVVEPREGLIEAPVGRDKRHRKQMAVIHTGREATTMYRAAEYFDAFTLLELRPHTGRTHQIRVHLSWMGYPLVGDSVYGRRRQQMLSDRHFLHAYKLSLVHPKTGQEVSFESPLPPELKAVLAKLRRQR